MIRQIFESSKQLFFSESRRHGFRNYKFKRNLGIQKKDPQG